MKQYKTREVLVETTEAGEGPDYAHPLKTSYENPIVAIHYVDTKLSCLKFETKDGEVGLHYPESDRSFIRLVLNPLDAFVKGIRVNYGINVNRIEFLNEKNQVLLSAGTSGR